MKKILKNVNWVNCTYAIFMLVLGIILISAPNTAMITICKLMGIVIIVSGVLEIVDYLLYKFEPFGLINGIFKIIFGIVIFVFAKYFMGPAVFAIAVGIAMLISGLFKMQNSLDARNIGLKYWWFYMIYSAILVGFSIFLMINPFKGESIFLIILGIFLILDAIMSLLAMYFVSGKVRKVKTKIIEAIKNGTNIEME